MYFRLRLKDGGSDPHSAGSLVSREGIKTELRENDVELRVLDRWRAPDGAVYPSRVGMTIRPLGKRLVIQPVLADQELRGGPFRYWEGAVDVFEEGRPEPAIARGYMELTGYAQAMGDGVER